ncbi:MAG: hypothetical protein C0444_03785 [Microbacterium sp.]|nr:hypothetical protein [Microbacterium sp.]MBA4345259.1 hypothetical protein [Microbacterium sp.]
MKAKAIALALVGGLALSLASVTPASAVTTVAPASEPAVATFGDAWMLELEVSATLNAEGGSYSPPINEASGTVDVFIEQVPGTFLDNLTVQSNGRVFVTQPPGQPLLAPGTYDLRAVFTPSSPETGLQTAQVRIPAAITITPLELTANISVVTDASAGMPRLTVALVGAGETELSALPPGVWNLSVREAAGSETLYSRQVLQTSALDPLVVELTDDLRPDVDHVLLAEFVPVAEYAAGVVVTGAGEIPFRTAPKGFGELLVSPIDVPVWALIVALVGLAAGVAGLVTALVVRARRAPRPVGATTEGDAADTAETTDVADIEELFGAPEEVEAPEPVAPAEAESGSDVSSNDDAEPDRDAEPDGDAEPCDETEPNDEAEPEGDAESESDAPIK